MNPHAYVVGWGLSPNKCQQFKIQLQGDNPPYSFTNETNIAFSRKLN